MRQPVFQRYDRFLTMQDDCAALRVYYANLLLGKRCLPPLTSPPGAVLLSSSAQLAPRCGGCRGSSETSSTRQVRDIAQPRLEESGVQHQHSDQQSDSEPLEETEGSPRSGVARSRVNASGFPVPEAVRCSGQHWAVHGNVRNRCRWCQREGRESKSNFSCGTCAAAGHHNIFLCSGECMRLFHSTRDDSTAVNAEGLHWAERKGTYKTCRRCFEQLGANTRYRSHFICRTCSGEGNDDIYLCLGARNCFQLYHTSGTHH